MESLVIVDQHATVNLYLSLVLTARHTLGIGWVGNERVLKAFLGNVSLLDLKIEVGFPKI